MLAKVTALVMVPVVPFNWRLYPADVVFKVVVVRGSLKAIVPKGFGSRMPKGHCKYRYLVQVVCE